MRREETLRSEDLRDALDEALRGTSERLEMLLSRHGGLPAPRPNSRLAAAFGEALAAHGAAGVALARRLAEVEADEEEREAFLAVAAVFAVCALERRGDLRARDARLLDDTLARLAADPRRVVRIGVTEALTDDASRNRADLLVARTAAWMESEWGEERFARELRFGACATTLEVLTDRNVLSALHDPAPLFALLDHAVEALETAPRAAERSAARRRLLNALAPALEAIVPAVRGAAPWFAGRCERLQHPDLREAVGRALDRLRGAKLGASELAALESALAASRPPPRDPTRAKDPRSRGRRGKRG
ncbi:MAG: hypothetical protein KF901_18735 [Myxococcales bacterium]|nr:hypothetical protein [Myxococcales bacterium]